MKKLFIMVVITMLLATTAKVSAQDSYSETFVEMLKLSPQYQNISGSMENMKGMLPELNKKLLKDQSKSEELINKYAESQMLTDFISAFFAPTMKEYITEAEIKDFKAILNTPEAKSYTEHEAVATQKMEQTITTIIIESLSSEKALKDLTEGKLNLKPVKIDPSIPADYIATFDDAFNEEYLDKMLGSISGALAQSSENPQVVESLMAYIKTNMRALCLNSYYGTASKEDFVWAKKHQANPTTKKFTDAMLQVMAGFSDQEKVQGSSFQFIMRYVMWLQKQGVEINN